MTSVGLLDDKLWNALPNGLIGLHDAGYTITTLYEEGAEIVCGMGYGMRDTNDWTVYVSDAYDLRIRFKAVNNRETDLIDYLMETGVNSEDAKYFSNHVRIRYERLLDRLFELSGNYPSDVCSVDELYDVWEIRVLRDITDIELSYVSDAVFDYVYFNDILLKKIMNRRNL